MQAVVAAPERVVSEAPRYPESAGKACRKWCPRVPIRADLEATELRQGDIGNMGPDDMTETREQQGFKSSITSAGGGPITGDSPKFHDSRGCSLQIAKEAIAIPGRISVSSKVLQILCSLFVLRTAIRRRKCRSSLRRGVRRSRFGGSYRRFML